MDVGIRDRHRRTPLHEAVLFEPERADGSLEVLDCLLAAGAPLEARDAFGNTPWMCAAYPVALAEAQGKKHTESFVPVDGYRRAAARLEAAGAVADTRSTIDLWVAVVRGDLRGVDSALDAGANPRAFVPHGIPAVSVAVDADRVEIVHALVNAGADLDAHPRPSYRGGESARARIERLGSPAMRAILERA